MSATTHKPRCWRFEDWPKIDQAAWLENCSPSYSLDKRHYASGLRAESLVKIRKGYGRWLCFLATGGRLDPTTSPLSRVTKQCVCDYLRALRAAGNADHTIKGRADELCMAMKILAPGANVSWIRKPFGLTVRAMLPMQKRPLVVPEPAVLLDWAYDIMLGASAKPTRIEGLCAFRDGLLLAILAISGRRLRSTSLMRVGHEIRKQNDRYRVEFQPEQVKTNKYDRFDLPPAFTPHIDRYLHEVRLALLGGRRSESFWISARGGQWTPKAIQSQVLALSKARFGIAFGPHRARHAIATFAPHLDPANPGIGAAILGISAEVCQDSYNRGSQAQSALAHQRGVEERRAAARTAQGRAIAEISRRRFRWIKNIPFGTDEPQSWKIMQRCIATNHATDLRQ